MRNTIRALAALLALQPVVAAAQQFPTVPAQSVIGRLSIPGDTGPAQAIPFATLSSRLSGPQNPNTVSAGPISGPATFSTFRALVGADLPLPAASTLGGVKSLVAIAHQFLTQIGTNGSVSQAQPACADLSTAAASCSTDATNAANDNTTQAGTGAVSRSVKSKLNDMINIADFGAVCNGSTDDTTAIQNAWNQGAARNLDVWLGGVGPTCKISSLTMPTPVAIGLGSAFGAARASMLHGPGANQVVLLSTVTGTTCAITISATYGTTSSLEGKFSGFGVNQIAQNQAGDGICLNNITKATFEDVSVSFFGVGLNANDVILLNVEKSWFEANSVQISGQQVSNSPPNGWNIKNNHFSNSGLFSIRLAAPSMVNIEGNDFESEGIPSTTSAIQVFVSSLSPSSGALGVNMVGNYIEGNAGTALQIGQGSQTVKSVHNFMYNVMARTRADNVGAVVIGNASAGAGALMYVNVGGNGLLDVSGAGGFTWLAAQASGATNYLFNCSQIANIVVPTTNMNATCVLAATGFR